MTLPNSIFTDGGVIGPNPTKLGGTWCWCWVTSGVILKHESGVVTPGDMGTEVVTNNVTELYAALRALESVPNNWHGTLISDSMVTLHRLRHSNRWKGVPDWMRRGPCPVPHGCRAFLLRVAMTP